MTLPRQPSFRVSFVLLGNQPFKSAKGWYATLTIWKVTHQAIETGADLEGYATLTIWKVTHLSFRILMKEHANSSDLPSQMRLHDYMNK